MRFLISDIKDKVVYDRIKGCYKSNLTKSFSLEITSNKERLEAWDKYLEKEIGMDFKGAILYIIHSFKVSKVEKSNCYLYLEDNSKADKIAKLITYGNSDIKGIPLITNMVKEHLWL